MTSFFISPLSELVKDAITAFAENSHQTNQLLALMSHDLIFCITPFTFAGERCHNSACRKQSPNKPVTGSDITQHHMTSFFISPLSELVKDATTALAENSHQTNQSLALISHDLIFYITPFTFAGERCHNSACRKQSPNKLVTGFDIT